VIDFSLVLENQISYYAGIIFKLVANIAQSSIQQEATGGLPAQADET
jgi:hypothetical protein